MHSGTIYGYARVSSKHQNEERQLIALRAFGIRDRDIYCDRQSGKDFDRPNYQRLLLRLQAGDVFVVKSIDRLGRNYNEILYQWRLLTNVWSSLDGSTKKAASPSGRCSSTQNM